MSQLHWLQSKKYDQMAHLYRPRNPMLGADRTMPATLAPATLCRRVFRVSKGYIMRVVLPLAMPPANAACIRSFFVLPFCMGGPALQ